MIVHIAKKPAANTIAEGVLEHATGALNVDGCRIQGFHLANQKRSCSRKSSWTGDSRVGKSQGMFAVSKDVPSYVAHKGGRYPMNVIFYVGSMPKFKKI